MNKKERTQQLTIMAMCVALNLVASKIAGGLSLPVFMDALGTVFCSILLGPIQGLITAITFAFVGFALGDPFELYLCHSAIIVAIITGLFFHGHTVSKISVWWKTLIASIPGSLITAWIISTFFGGFTTSNSSNILIALMRHIGMSTFQAALIMQIAQDYLDRIVCVLLTFVVIAHLPNSIKGLKMQKNSWSKKPAKSY